MATKKETAEKDKTSSQETESAAKSKVKTKTQAAAKPKTDKKTAATKSKASQKKVVKSASDKPADQKAVAPKATKAKKPSAAQIQTVSQHIESLSDSSRRHRQEAAHELADIAATAPEAFEGKVEDLIDALYRPEAQTRWEILSALANLSEKYGEEVVKAFDGAEASLFDESSSTVRLSAFLFLARYGSTSQKHSDAAWPLLNEAIQCYHGDAEYYDMLVGILAFAKSDISKETKKALKERFLFDSENASGYMKKFSAEIVAAVK